MREDLLPRPAVTIATVVMRDGAFLCVEEETRAGVRLNQPAGHLERGESLWEGAARETLEETGYAVEPTALVGIYRWQAPDSGAAFIRFSFAARVIGHDPARPLDRGIVRAGWYTYDDLVARRAEHRSPLVLRCIDDFRTGRTLPHDILIELPE